MPKITRIRSVPWLVVVQVGLAANARWKNLSRADRERLTALLRKSRGRPSNLSKREQEDVRLLMGQLDLTGLARELVPFARESRRRR